MEKFILTTTWGFEDITANEAKRFGVKVVDVLDGKVIVEAPIDFVYYANYGLRTVEKVYIYLNHGEFSTLDDIKRIVEDADLTEYISGEETFGVKTKRFGTHNFTSIDVNKVVGEVIRKKYDLRVYLDNPDLEIKTWVVENTFVIGINTTGYSLYRRGYRIYQHPAPLKPTISSLLLMFSEWTPNKSLLDPMCGSGTILIEAALLGRNVPPGFFRPFYQFYRLKIFDRNAFLEVKQELNSKINNTKKMKIFGIELLKKHVIGAIYNALSARVIDTIGLKVGDARKLSKTIEEPFDVIVTNPPYGLKIASKKHVLDLYEKFVKELERCSWKSTVVVMTAEDYFWKLIKDTFTVIEVREIMYGDLPTKVYKFRL